MKPELKCCTVAAQLPPCRAPPRSLKVGSLPDDQNIVPPWPSSVNGISIVTGCANSVPLGSHEIVVKRAGGGDRRITATVTVNPYTLHVDFSKPAG